MELLTLIQASEALFKSKITSQVKGYKRKPVTYVNIFIRRTQPFHILNEF